MNAFFNFLVVGLLIISNSSLASAGWKTLYSTSTKSRIAQIVADKNTLYGIVDRSPGGHRPSGTWDAIIRSMDGGKTWSGELEVEQSGNTLSIADLDIDQILISSKGTLIVVGYSHFTNSKSQYPGVVIYTSRDQGNSFKNVLIEPESFCCQNPVQIEESSTGQLLVGYSDSHMFVNKTSFDDGNTWQKIDYNLSSGPFSQNSRNFFKFSPDGKSVFFSTLSGVISQTPAAPVNGQPGSQTIDATLSGWQQTITNGLQLFGDSQGEFLIFSYGQTCVSTSLFKCQVYDKSKGFFRWKLNSTEGWSTVSPRSMLPNLAKDGFELRTTSVIDFGLSYHVTDPNDGDYPIFTFVVFAYKFVNGRYQFDAALCDNTEKGWSCDDFTDSKFLGSTKNGDGRFVYNYSEKPGAGGKITVLEKN